MKKLLFAILIGIIMMFISTTSKATAITDSLKNDITIAQVLDNFQGNVFSVINDLKPEAKIIFKQQCKTEVIKAKIKIYITTFIFLLGLIFILIGVHYSSKEEYICKK